ncbi:class I SAM-dependent methyltransferase [Hymenobacter mucosus]|uniref:class I SAM-dependent methyltransferase n=1 Tax=Hymenobacter mucosus TaxID=1411120 RepID=UPI000B789451|nr:class I SAM-dependent methyltransferase [Hymenobacter mucosus]
MHSDYEATYHQIEEGHWWFQARRGMVFQLIQELQLPKSASILEIGCSGGPLLLALRQAGYTNLTGIDISAQGVQLAKQRGFEHVAVMDGAKLEFADASFDLVIASDVLEHIENENQALQEWKRVLRPGGQLIVFVPAFQFLWSSHDDVNQHFRRYSSQQLSTAIAHNGLQQQRLSYWNSLLFAPVALVRLLRKLLPGTEPSPSGDLQLLPAFLNTSLLSLLRTENRILRHLNLPVGVSVFALARKPA